MRRICVDYFREGDTIRAVSEQSFQPFKPGDEVWSFATNHQWRWSAVGPLVCSDVQRHGVETEDGQTFVHGHYWHTRDEMIAAARKQAARLLEVIK